ncbi:PadR family transcriptional regulator [Sinobacterium caligoides]|uniref:PadR family transcriptional regulator n=1 Tax=Sinobacterium caligoides TaxID=933926 RepID=A0A3N2DPL6_9GAMM|nr:PadR family transcriptional regulator [Sinobacterium caligoides]ROS01730.1 PadR family transcriptional regulator [Sinobacterium caligoides]
MSDQRVENMSLKHAVLALLQAEEGSGYDLSKRFKSGLGYFWSASHQQIYQQLKKMLAEQLIDVREMPQVGKPDKKVYQITALGEEVLRQWIESPCKASKVNDAFLVKLYAGDCVDNQVLLAKIVEQQEYHRKLLATFELLERQYLDLDPAQRSSYKLPYMTLRKGILGEQAWLAWSKEALALLTD